MLYTNKKFFSVVNFMFVSVLSSFCLLFVNSNPVSASTLSMNISTNTLTANVAPKNTSGTFAASDTADIFIATDNYTGYTLGIKAANIDSNATNLVNTTDNTKTINSISSIISESDFSASANTQYNNTWGYKPSKFNSVVNTTNYYPSPTVSGDILDTTNTSNSTANTYTISFGTRISPDTTPGIYSNSYIITAIVNPIPYSITYDKNTTDTVTSMPTPNPDVGSTYDGYVEISSAIPERDGYGFVSWCSSNTSETSCSGYNYLPRDYYVLDQSSDNNDVTLYAIWSKDALLDTGTSVSRTLKQLAGNNSADYYTQDTSITAIVRSSSLPNDFTPNYDNIISDYTSPLPIYAWYDSADATIYYYSTATNIFLNQDSSYLFNNMYSLYNLSTISSWDASNVTNMSRLFDCTGYDATNFSLDLSSWDTSNVTNMSSLFNSAGRNSTTWFVDGLSSWDVSSVTNMMDIFAAAGYNASAFELDLSSWKTTSLINMTSMFVSAGRNASSWSVGDLSSWNTDNVTNMQGLFNAAGYSASSWSVGDLSSWNTTNVTKMQNMFSSAGYSAALFDVSYVSSWDTSNVTDMSGMFASAGHNASSWSVGDLSSWNTTNVTDMRSMFLSAGYSVSSFVLDLSAWDVSNVTNTSNMFHSAGYNATTFNLNISSWNTSNVTAMSEMFGFAGNNATSRSIIIPKTNDGTSTGPISNTSNNLYGKTTSVYAFPGSNGFFTLAD